MGPTPPRQRAGPRVAAVTRRSADFVDYGKQPLPRSVVEDVAWELGVSRATLYRLIELYKTFGTVDVLQPSATGRRSGTWVLPKATEQIIEETIHNVYLKPTRPTLTHLVDCVHARCTEEGVAPPYRRTVCARVKAIDIRVRGPGAANAISSRRPQQSLGNMQLAVRLRSCRSIIQKSTSSLSTN
jgi:hypothetical protein